MNAWPRYTAPPPPAPRVQPLPDEAPVYVDGATPGLSVAPVVMVSHEKAKLRTAAFRAKQVWPTPNPLGRLVERELLSGEEFAYLGSTRQALELADFVMRQDIPR